VGDGAGVEGAGIGVDGVGVEGAGIGRDGIPAQPTDNTATSIRVVITTKHFFIFVLLLYLRVLLCLNLSLYIKRKTGKCVRRTIFQRFQNPTEGD